MPRYFLLGLLLILSMVLLKKNLSAENLFYIENEFLLRHYFPTLFSYSVLLFYYFSVRVRLCVRFYQAKITIIAAKRNDRVRKICNLQFQLFTITFRLNNFHSTIVNAILMLQFRPVSIALSYYTFFEALLW